jgi:hypothetical protein
LEAQILNIHDLNANLNYLSSNVLSLYCIFDVQNFVLCLNCELIEIIDYKIMLKSLCKTTFNSVFVGKKIIKIETWIFKICASKKYLKIITKNYIVLASDVLLVKISSKSNKNWVWNILKNCGYIPVWRIAKKLQWPNTCCTCNKIIIIQKLEVLFIINIRHIWIRFLSLQFQAEWIVY